MTTKDKSDPLLTAWNAWSITNPIGGNRRWLDGSMADLNPGTIVRARRPIDRGAADVQAGDLGIVFGRTNCYSDSAGPIVRWFRGNEIGGVCNIYPWTAEALHVLDFEE